MRQLSQAARLLVTRYLEEAFVGCNQRRAGCLPSLVRFSLLDILHTFLLFCLFCYFLSFYLLGKACGSKVERGEIDFPVWLQFVIN